MVKNLTTLTERGQISIPVALRKKLKLRSGQTLLWQAISETECRIVVVRTPAMKTRQSARGIMKQFQNDMPSTTNEWMKLLREGEGA